MKKMGDISISILMKLKKTGNFYSNKNVENG
jgi:hypothetical protein